MRYRDLKQERDEAVARAVEAERLSMKSEFDRVTAKFEQEKERLERIADLREREAYRLGFVSGAGAMADEYDKALNHVHPPQIPEAWLEPLPTVSYEKVQS